MADGGSLTARRIIVAITMGTVIGDDYYGERIAIRVLFGILDRLEHLGETLPNRIYDNE